jgi:CHASE3 domain sensor protein
MRFLPILNLKACWKALPLEVRGSIAIAIPLICLVFSVGANLVLRQKVSQAQAYVAHTQKVLLSSHSALIALLDAETGMRGYYLSWPYTRSPARVSDR